MSIPVDVGEVEAAFGEHGTGSGYLLTTSGDGRVKAVTVDPVFADGAVVVRGPGGGSLRNVGADPAVTLLFPPRAHHGYTLLVDGAAEVVGDDGSDLSVTPASAVLHRPSHHAGPDHAGHAGHEHAAGGCGHDCAPVT